MEKMIRWIEKCSVWGGYAAGLFMVLIVILIGVEIAARTLFNASTMIADEYSAYFFVAVVMLGLGFSLRDGAHIRITLLHSHLGRRGRQVMELAAALMAMILCGFALYHSILMVHDSYLLEMTADSISETPIYIPQIMIPVGLILFMLQLAAVFTRRLLSSQIP